MEINVHTLLHLKGKKLPLEQNYELLQLEERNKQILQVGPVKFEGFGEMSAGIFSVKGNVTGSCILACSRCLAEMEHSFNQDFEERFNIDSNISVLDEDEDIHQIEGNQIDLLPFIEDEVLVSLPYIPLCPTDDCKSDLPKEGKNWNLITDKTSESKIDPRLADLAKFFENK